MPNCVFCGSKTTRFIGNGGKLCRVGDFGMPAGALAEVADENVVCDVKQIGGKTRRGRVFPGTLEDLDEGLLRKILGGVNVVERSVEKVDQRLLPLEYEHTRGRGVARRDPRHQQNIRLVIVHALSRKT